MFGKSHKCFSLCPKLDILNSLIHPFLFYQSSPNSYNSSLSFKRAIRRQRRLFSYKKTYRNIVVSDFVSLFSTYDNHTILII